MKSQDYTDQQLLRFQRMLRETHENIASLKAQKSHFSEAFYNHAIEHNRELLTFLEKKIESLESLKTHLQTLDSPIEYPGRTYKIKFETSNHTQHEVTLKGISEKKVVEMLNWKYAETLSILSISEVTGG